MKRKTQQSLEEQIKNKALNIRKRPQIELIPSGCDVLDVHMGGGFPLGGVVNFAGKPSSAKTLIILMHIAKCIRKYGDKFKWRYDDVEHGMYFDTESMFGFSIGGNNIFHSETVEKFNYNFTKFAESLRKGEKGVYVVDSLDMLPSQASIKRSKEEHQTYDAGKIYDKGTYGKEKQMYLSADFFNQKAALARDTNCTLIFISQIRDNFGVVFGEKHKKGGGWALNHANALEIWLYKKKDIIIEKTIRNVKRRITIGSEMEARVKKNKITGERSRCFFEVVDDMGIDNIGSLVDYVFGLKKDDGGRNRPSLMEWDGREFKQRKSLIQYIEQNSQEDKLLEEAYLLRKEIQEASSSKDRKRYND